MFIVERAGVVLSQLMTKEETRILAEQTQRDIDNRSMVARKAITIVRKFPQIEQEVLAPMLMREIGKALLDQQTDTAANCAKIAADTRLLPRRGRKYLAAATDVNGMVECAYKEAACQIRLRYGLEP